MNMVALLAIPLIVRFEHSPQAFWISAVLGIILLVVLFKNPGTKDDAEFVQKA